jgi:hypothetical protein
MYCVKIILLILKTVERNCINIQCSDFGIRYSVQNDNVKLNSVQ